MQAGPAVVERVFRCRIFWKDFWKSADLVLRIFFCDWSEEHDLDTTKRAFPNTQRIMIDEREWLVVRRLINAIAHKKKFSHFSKICLPVSVRLVVRRRGASARPPLHSLLLVDGSDTFQFNGNGCWEGVDFNGGSAGKIVLEIFGVNFIILWKVVFHVCKKNGYVD